MHYEILDLKRKNILSLFKFFKDRFYLAGGTALALQLGHRDSLDFDFFMEEQFDPQKLLQELEIIFKDHSVVTIQIEKNTLSITIDETIKISFFTFPYRLLKPLINEENINIASVEDIACMKLLAITSRSTLKDYVDLYVVLQKIDLDELLNLAEQKFPTIDRNVILKSLVYFDDVSQEKIMFKIDKIDFKTIQTTLKDKVKKLTPLHPKKQAG